MANAVPMQFKQRLLEGEIDFNAHTFRLILMATGFVFDIDNHYNYAHVAAPLGELATGFGYTQGMVASNLLSGYLLTQDLALDRSIITWANKYWTAAGGTLTASGAIIIDDSHANDAIICYFDAGGDIVAVDGTPLVVSNISISLGDLV